MDSFTLLSFFQAFACVSYWQNSIGSCRTRQFSDVTHIGQLRSGKTHVTCKIPSTYSIKGSVKSESGLLFTNMSVRRRRKNSSSNQKGMRVQRRVSSASFPVAGTLMVSIWAVRPDVHKLRYGHISHLPLPVPKFRQLKNNIVSREYIPILFFLEGNTLSLPFRQLVEIFAPWSLVLSP